MKRSSPTVCHLSTQIVTPGAVFSQVDIDYAGPLPMKLRCKRKPTGMKVYICVFVCLAVKAVHLELVTDLTTEAFIACLCRFMAQKLYRSKPRIGTTIFIPWQQSYSYHQFLCFQKIMWKHYLYDLRILEDFGSSLWRAPRQSGRHHTHDIWGTSFCTRSDRVMS